jgi:signal transduction histidine kinase
VDGPQFCQFNYQFAFCTGYIMDTNETKIYITLLGALVVLTLLMAFLLATILRYQKRKVTYHTQKLREDFDFLDKEKQRISLDLHDDIGASLSTIQHRLDRLTTLNESSAAIVKECEMILADAMQKLRRISVNMMPPILKRMGLDAALSDLIGIMTFDTGIDVHYYCEPIHFTEETAKHIYRIAQEIINNIIKHSQATSFDFTIQQNDGTIRMLIHDDGVGFDDKTLREKTGLGLHNIAARADLLKADIYLSHKKGEGVEYLIEIPAYEPKNKSNHRR